MQAVSLAPPPAPRPLAARRVLRLVRPVLDQPEQTDLVFEAPLAQARYEELLPLPLDSVRRGLRSVPLGASA